MNAKTPNQAPADPAPRRPRNTQRLTCLLLLVVFVAGAVVGWGLKTIVAPERQRRGRRGLEEARDSLTKKIADRVDLTAEQTEQLRPIIHQRMLGLRELRKEMQPRMQQQADVLNQEVRAILTAEQTPEWEAYYADLLERWFSKAAEGAPATGRGHRPG